MRLLSVSDVYMYRVHARFVHWLAAVPLLLPGVYTYANTFEPARFAIFCLIAIATSLIIVLILEGHKRIAAGVTALLTAYASAGFYYPFPLSPGDLNERLARLLNPSVRMSVTETFSTPLQDVYTGKHYGRSVGLWGGKGPPQANFTQSKDGFITIWPGRQAYFEYMPATARNPFYINTTGGIFSVKLRAQSPVIANGKPHLFVCGGNHGCYYHKRPFKIGTTWTTNTREFNPAQFIAERGKAGDTAVNVLKRAGYIGVMWISNTNWRGDVNLKTHVDLDEFSITTSNLTKSAN